MIGDGNHYFNKKLVERLKKYSPETIIDFFSFFDVKNNALPYDNIVVANSNTIKVPFFFNFPGIKGIYINHKLSERLKNYIGSRDYTHFHIQSAHPSMGFAHKSLCKYGKIILTIWGSDFYRSNKLKSFFQNKLYRAADTITFASSNVKKDFIEKIGLKKDYRIVRFGLDLLAEIDKQRKTYKKVNMGIVNITIGYNRHKAQQHLKVIDQLKNLEGEIKNKLHIILPFTYGPKDLKYRSSLEKILKINNFSYEFIDEFLSEFELSKLRLKTDIMIQTQTTDQFSGSMQEHLYAGNFVITGSWLKYDDMSDSGMKFEKIDNFEDLLILIPQLLKSTKFNINVKCNKKVVRLLSSWESNIIKWYELYT